MQQHSLMRTAVKGVMTEQAVSKENKIKDKVAKHVGFNTVGEAVANSTLLSRQNTRVKRHSKLPVMMVQMYLT